MFTEKPNRFALVLGLTMLTMLIQACAGTSQFTRVEEFPQGLQTSLMTSALLQGYEMGNTTEKIFEKPYASVWEAAKVATQKLSKIGKRPVVAVEEETGRIQNGQISQDRSMGAGAGAAADEFLTEVTELSNNQTKVSISRRVVMVNSGRWTSQKSNGQIENWVLTQIENQLAK